MATKTKPPKAQELIPSRAGLSEGASGSDVQRLQDYLARFGYKNTSPQEDYGIDSFNDSDLDFKEGEFDEATREALVSFQEFNSLPATGKLDDQTLNLMQQPRCGCPDMAEFANTGRRWPTTNLTYGFQEFTPDLPKVQVIRAIEQALSLWQAVTPLCFRRVAMSSSPDIVIRFAAGAHGDGNPFDGTGGVLAHAYFPPVPPNPPTPIQGDAHFDEDEKWTVTIPTGAGNRDLVTVAAHEFGHSLGLGHSGVSTALMAPFYSGPHRFLHSDDIAGIRDIYGVPKIAHAMWVHGTSIQVEYESRIQHIRRAGFYTRIIGKPNTTNWFHFAIPSSVITHNDRKRIGSVILRFRTRSSNAIVRDVHIYDGYTRILAHNGVNLSGNHWFERFGVAHCPPALWGVGISIGVTFGAGSDSSRSMDFVAAGCDFRP
ncbi:MAG: DUF6623 family protein [bacterium]